MKTTRLVRVGLAALVAGAVGIGMVPPASRLRRWSSQASSPRASSWPRCT